MKWKTLSSAALCVIFFAALGCVTTGNGETKSTRTVLVNGVETPVEEVAKDKYDQAVQAKQAGELTAAEAQFKTIISDYPDASWADFATVALAQMEIDSERAAEGKARLDDLLLKKPKTPAAEQARLALALAELKTGDTESGSKKIADLVEKMATPEEKRETALKLADELFASGEAGEATRFLSRAHELTENAEDKTELEERLLALVDTEVSFRDLQRLKATDGVAKKGSYLDELLTYKLARVFLHLRDEVRAQEQTADYLARFPTGTFAEDARTLNKALQNRVKVDDNKVGCVLPMTGKYKVYGKRALASIRLGLGLPAEQNEAPGRPTLIVKDSAGDPTKAAEAVKELVERDHVIAIVGSLLLDTASVVALAGEDYAVPTISLSRQEKITELGPWSYRLAFTPSKQAKALALVAMDGFDMKRFGILYPKHSYGLEFMNAFWDTVEAKKGEVTAVETYAHDQTTFTTQIKSLVGRLDVRGRSVFIRCRAEARALEDPYRKKKALEKCGDEVKPTVDFQAIIIPDDYRTVSFILPALEAEDIIITQDGYRISQYRKATNNRSIKPVRVLLGSLGDPAKLIERVDGRNADGTLIVQGYHASAATSKNGRFRKAFRTAMGSGPSMLDAHAYDAGAVLGALLSGVTVEKPRDRRALKQLLDGLEDFPGVTGLVKFDDTGDSATKPTFFRITNGRIEVAKPSDLKGPGQG